LLYNYLLGDSKESLTGHGENVLVNILLLNGVERNVIDQLVQEVQNSLENPVILNVAVNAALNNINPPPNNKNENKEK
jgi:hypothetical protein